MAKVIFGKTVLTTLEEKLESKQTALLVIDMTNDFCSAGGAFIEKHGGLERKRAILAPLARLIAAARQAGVLVVYTRGGGRDGGLMQSPAYLSILLKLHGGGDLPQTSIAGTWGNEIVDELRPLSGDLIVHKNRFTAFRATNLDLILRSSAVQSVVVTGVGTSGCVHATIWDAIYDYYVVVAKDCVMDSDLEAHNLAMAYITRRLPEGAVTESTRIIDVWSRLSAVSKTGA